MLSRRRFLVGGLASLLGAVLAACAAALESVVPRSPSTTATATAAATASPSPAPTATAPPLRDRIAQMLLVGFRGTTLVEAAATARDISDRGLGGVLLFSVDQLTGGERNIQSPGQLASLVSDLAGLATGAPLLVAVDQEGGRVARLGPANGFAATPSAAEMGRGEPGQTRAVAHAMAETLASVGVTLNLAPVVDLAVNPDNPIIAGVDRSFGADPSVVIAHATAFVEAHHDMGIRCALKHFPGQGSAGGDTHLGVVDVTGAWTEQELEPFDALVDAGLADAILTAHIFNADLDPDHPATLSRATITGILRGRLAFDGVVISDDLQMGAIRDAYGYEEAVALAIEAGVDLLLVANQLVYEPGIVSETIDIVERLVRDGRIGEGRIQASYERILRLKG
jgi:beta-N-acetylhexosaminidase